MIRYKDYVPQYTYKAAIPVSTSSDSMFINTAGITEFRWQPTPLDSHLTNSITNHRGTYNNSIIQMVDEISQASAILVTNRTYSASSSNLDDTIYINWCSKRIKNLLDTSVSSYQRRRRAHVHVL